MAIESKIANSYLTEIFSGTHLSSHSYSIAMYVSTADIGRNSTCFASGVALGELPTANGYTAGGVTLTGFSATLSASVSILDFADAAWASSTFSAYGAMIYNRTLAGKNAVACFSFGATVTGGGGTFTIVMPAVAAATGLIRLNNAS